MSKAKCPACKSLGQSSSIRRIYPIKTESSDNASRWCDACEKPIIGAVWRYECSRGHAFDGDSMTFDTINGLCPNCDSKKRQS